MATSPRGADPSLASQFLKEVYEFDFFQAVRLLSWMYPERALISGLGEPPEQFVRFRARLSMQFAASALHEVVPKADGRMDIITAFMGITGPQGILPAHYTEYLIGRRYEKDTAAGTFFDLFNHRLIGLFYLAWEKHHFPIAYEMETLHGAERQFTHYLFDLIGMGTRGLQNRLPMPDEALLPYSGLLGQRPHSATALEGLLRDFFSVPAEVEQFRGAWVTLEDRHLSYLGPPGLHNQLGMGAVAGDAVWNQEAGFRVRLGPLTFQRFAAFLPDGSAYPELVGLIRYFAGLNLRFDMQLILNASEVPFCSLGGDEPATRLGWSTWLKTGEFTADADDLLLTQ